MPWIVNNSGADYAGIGIGRSTGTKLISASGNIKNQGAPRALVRHQKKIAAEKQKLANTQFFNRNGKPTPAVRINDVRCFLEKRKKCRNGN